VYWPTLVPAELVEHRVVLPDGRVTVVPHSRGAVITGTGIEGTGAAREHTDPGEASAGPTRRVPLGRICAARSGDKGGNANIGVWTRDSAGYRWLSEHLTVARLRDLLPEAAELEIHRYELPNLHALNFVVVGLLGGGVADSARPDPQAKGLGEYLRSRYVDVPTALLSGPPTT
jgi:hypothetical protein